MTGIENSLNNKRLWIKVFEDLGLKPGARYPENVTPDCVEKLRAIREDFFRKLNTETYNELFGESLRVEKQNLFSRKDIVQYLGFKGCKRTVEQVVNKAHLTFLLPKNVFQKIYGGKFEDRLTNSPSIGDANFISYLEDLILDYGKKVQLEENKWAQGAAQREKYKDWVSPLDGEKMDFEENRKAHQQSLEKDFFTKRDKVIATVKRVHHLIENSQDLRDMTPTEYKEFLDEFLLVGESNKRNFIKNYFSPEEENLWEDL